MSSQPGLGIWPSDDDHGDRLCPDETPGLHVLRAASTARAAQWARQKRLRKLLADAYSLLPPGMVDRVRLEAR